MIAPAPHTAPTPAAAPLVALRGVAADLDRRGDGWAAAGADYHALSFRAAVRALEAAR